MTILLIDDHALFAKSLEIALEDYPQIDQFVSTTDIEQLPMKIQTLDPDIILMDINLGTLSEEDGLLLAKSILSRFPDQKIIILSGYDLPVYQYEAQKIGTKGFVNKSIAPEEFINILGVVEKGGVHFPSPKNNLIIEELTIREKEILHLASTGMKQKEIASQLFLSERTVSNHLQHIFEKLQVSSSIEAVTKAIQLGYLSL